MASSQQLHALGKQVVFADFGTDFTTGPGTAANSLVRGTPLQGQIALNDVAGGASRQSTKATLVNNTGFVVPMSFAVHACIQNVSAPTADGVWTLTWFPSPSATAGTGNGGALTGADGAYTVATGALAQGINIGDLTVRAAGTNIGFVGVLTTYDLYGSLVVTNTTSTAHSADADETHIVFNPIIPEDQPPAIRIAN